MSLTFISDFQKYIYKILSENSEINKRVKKIYFGIIQDGKYPAILVDITQADNKSFRDNDIYSIEMQISVFGKDKHHKLLISIGDEIVNALKNAEAFFTKYQILGLNAHNILFSKANDLVLNKLEINYKSMIRQADYE